MVLSQNRTPLLRKNPKKEAKQAEQFGRKRTSHARSEVGRKKLAGFSTGRLACFFTDQNGLLLHRPR
jgi:hypothetical protein